MARKSYVTRETDGWLEIRVTPQKRVSWKRLSFLLHLKLNLTLFRSQLMSHIFLFISHSSSWKLTEVFVYFVAVKWNINSNRSLTWSRVKIISDTTQKLFVFRNNTPLCPTLTYNTLRTTHSLRPLLIRWTKTPPFNDIPLILGLSCKSSCGCFKFNHWMKFEIRLTHEYLVVLLHLF